MAVIDRTEETLSSTKKVFGIFSRVRDAWNARKEPYSEVTAQWERQLSRRDAEQTTLPNGQRDLFGVGKLDDVAAGKLKDLFALDAAVSPSAGQDPDGVASDANARDQGVADKHLLEPAGMNTKLSYFDLLYENGIHIFDGAVNNLALFISTHGEVALTNPDMKFKGFDRRNTLNKLIRLANLEFNFALGEFENAPIDDRGRVDTETFLKLEMILISEKLANNTETKLSLAELYALQKRLQFFNERLEQARIELDPVWVEAFENISAKFKGTVKSLKPQYNFKLPPVITLQQGIAGMRERAKRADPVKAKASTINARTQAVADRPRDLKDNLQGLYDYISQNPIALVQGYDPLTEKNNWRSLRTYITRVRSNLVNENPKFAEILDIDKSLLTLMKYIADGPKQEGRIKQYKLEKIVDDVTSIIDRLDALTQEYDYVLRDGSNKPTMNRDMRQRVDRIKQVAQLVFDMAEDSVLAQLNDAAKSGKDILETDVVKNVILSLDGSCRKGEAKKARSKLSDVRRPEPADSPESQVEGADDVTLEPHEHRGENAGKALLAERRNGIHLSDVALALTSLNSGESAPGLVATFPSPVFGEALEGPGADQAVTLECPYVKNVMNITGGIARVTYQFQGNVYDSNYKIYGTFSADPTDNQANLLLKALVEAWETNNFKLVRQLISKELDPASGAELVEPIIPDTARSIFPGLNNTVRRASGLTPPDPNAPMQLFTRVSHVRQVVPIVFEYTLWEKILIRLFPNMEAQINDAKRARMRAAQEYTTKPQKLVPTDIPNATGKPGGPSADTSDLATEGALDHANEAPKGPTLGL